MNKKTQYTKITKNGKTYLKICKSSDLFAGKGKRFFFGDDYVMQLAVFRIKSKLYCLHNICPHRYQDVIHQGIIKDLQVTCPAHGWTYSLEDGQNIIRKQGIKSLATFEIFEEEGSVYIEEPVFQIPKWRQSFESNSE